MPCDIQEQGRASNDGTATSAEAKHGIGENRPRGEK